ncbi:MAG: UDP- glucuronosyltransferase [Gemmatimonadota bacterium]|nr:UDP- glucuronosyltransferase [Gemmatimonadota bacterium]
MGALKVAFVVQGEGRGHMTQALALGSVLRDAGHEVTEVLVGRSPHRPVPSYFTKGMDAPVRAFHAPTQVAKRDGQGLSVGRTVADAVRRAPAFVQSVVSIAEHTAHADVIVNLLDLLGGVSRTIFPSDVPAIAVAHNYVFLHPALSDAPGPSHVKRMVLAYARVTAARTVRKVALSFSPLPPVPEMKLEVAPPLLRPGLEDLATEAGDYLLAYALNPGYADTLAAWQSSAGGVRLHCYVEGGASALTVDTSEGFHAHELDDRPFLEHLAGCRAYVGSAGFESICEAHHLGKPVLAVPTQGQFEQELNAWDAARCGVARAGGYEDLDRFWRSPDPPHRDRTDAFRKWVARAPGIFVDAIERTSHRA